MENNNITIPKTFISYSRSSEEHEKWVITLATELRESNVDVVLDKWDLKEGADKYKFMEQMVTNPEIKKVIIISDRIYAEKADGRSGGVGTETQIISQEIYNQLDSTSRIQKFVAVITEKDDDGKVYLPVFLKPRIYIDFTSDLNYAESFEQLVRWLYDKPLYIKPPLGKTPTFITNENQIELGTSSRIKVAINAIIKNKESAIGSCIDYFDYFAENLEKFRITETNNHELDDLIIESIQQLLPYRDEFIDLISKIAKYYPHGEIYDDIGKFFEHIIHYAFWPKDVQSYVIVKMDNYRFFLYETFLYVVAILIKHDRFSEANSLIERKYYMASGSPDIDAGLYPFTIFKNYLSSLDKRNQRLNLRRISLMSDLLKNRATRKDITFDDLMQSDYILFLRSEYAELRWWFPHTLLYASSRRPIFENFLRSQSKKYFEKFKIILGVNSVDELRKFLLEFKNGERKNIVWEGEWINPFYLVNLDDLASAP
ncbi:SEFIR domain-containing protein [Clostridium sp.]|uniref:SEFIR domain-containing protein n=1 Tax=Clostridium sp. TaxID=1506 RepID=UPI00283F5670|nr:SEFIR domain-containing protein [Clostridium sp.]MDR3594566.1 TIR domain-containing protein [Clostridium sp.]